LSLGEDADDVGAASDISRLNRSSGLVERGFGQCRTIRWRG
jgi:hypothetical protein